jgi:hypothetical protein
MDMKHHDSSNPHDLNSHSRFGLANALTLGIIKPEQTVMAVQGWKGGLGHVSDCFLWSHVIVGLWICVRVAQPHALLNGLAIIEPE